MQQGRQGVSKGAEDAIGLHGSSSDSVTDINSRKQRQQQEQLGAAEIAAGAEGVNAYR